MRKIKNNFDYIVNIINKHGLLGRKKQMELFFTKWIDVSWYDKKASRVECRKLYQTIRKKYVEIRVHLLRGDRIGESIPQYLMAVEETQRNVAKGILDIFVLEGPIIYNSRLLAIMSRRIHIVNKGNVTLWTYVLSRFPKVEYRKYIFQYNRKCADAINPKDTVRYLAMETSEEKEAKYKKREMGLKGVFVCVSSRDSAYLETTFPDCDNTLHDYRDSNINYLNLSAEYLQTKDVTMVRMGRFVKTEVQFGNCIDYANKYYDELMDVALMRDCKFYVGDPSGIVILPMTFNIPCVFKNAVPVFLDAWGGHPQNPQNLFIFKKYYSKAKKRFLSIREMMEVEKECEYYGQRYAEAQIELVENTAEEILDLVKEMNERIDGKWIESEEDIQLRNQYRDVFNQWCEQEGYNDGAMLQANVGAVFLKKNRFLLD